MISKSLILLGILIITVKSEIIYKSAHIEIGSSINLETGVVDSQKFCYGIDTSSFNDLYIVYGERPAMDGCCYQVLIGSPNIFYLSKESFDNSNFESGLDVSDTLKYYQFDSLGNLACPVTNFNPSFLVPEHTFRLCWSSGNNYDTSPYFIFKTLNNNYSILKINNYNHEQFVVDTNKTYSCLSAIDIEWYLQTDGTLNFNGVSASTNKNKMVNKELVINYSVSNKLVKIFFPISANLSVYIMDINGKILTNLYRENNEFFLWDVRNFGSGIYLLKYKYNNKVFIYKYFLIK